MKKLTQAQIDQLKKEGWKEGYKFLRRYNKRLYSLIVGGMLHHGIPTWVGAWIKPVRYQKYVVTKPAAKHGPLVVIDSLVNANGFMGSLCNLGRNEIAYRCLYLPTKAQCNYAWGINTRNDEEEHMPLVEMMKGSVLADAVILLEKENFK